MFAISFFVTRLVLYAYVVKVSTFEAPKYRDLGPGWVCVIGLWVLYCLQIFWFGLIAKMAYNIFIKGEDLEDIRSDDEIYTDSKKKK